MADTDILLWIDATGEAHIPLNVPEFNAAQYAIVRQIRHYFDVDTRFWQRQPLTDDDVNAVDQLLCVILPKMPHTELARCAVWQKAHFLIRWFAL